MAERNRNRLQLLVSVVEKDRTWSNCFCGYFCPNQAGFLPRNMGSLIEAWRSNIWSSFKRVIIVNFITPWGREYSTGTLCVCKNIISYLLASVDQSGTWTKMNFFQSGNFGPRVNAWTLKCKKNCKANKITYALPRKRLPKISAYMRVRLAVRLTWRWDWPCGLHGCGTFGVTYVEIILSVRIGSNSM